MVRKSRAAPGEDREDAKLRIAVVNGDRCKPGKCNQECKRDCPVVRQGKLCVEVTKQSKTASVSEPLCSGCGICVKKCPFNALRIINLPHHLTKDTTHRHGPNGFKLHRLPIPRRGQVLGLVGANGMGKSTALSILAGPASGGLTPNLGRHDPPPVWKDIIAHFRGSELHAFFSKLLEDSLRARIKPQYVDRWVKSFHAGARVGDILGQCAQRDSLLQDLEIGHLMDRELCKLSGGEAQRVAIASVCAEDVEIYMFDEPSAFLDIRQRLRAARAIKSLSREGNYVIAVEHDLAVLEYLSDYVCCLYGSASGYGVVTMPFGVREGINVFLSGFIPTENMRFREEALTFRIAQCADQDERQDSTQYPRLVKSLGADDNAGFRLDVEPGEFSSGEIIVMLGQNGVGKTTFINMLAGRLMPDDGPQELPKLRVSVKPQEIKPGVFEGTVQDLFLAKIRSSFQDPVFQSEVLRPLLMGQLLHLSVSTLSGGELQRVALVLALGKPADIYLLDEPSAYLDVEQRIAACRVIRRFVLHSRATAFVVEHDFIMATYLADRVIVYEGQPGVRCLASAPMPLLEGMNVFLSQLDVTFRRDARNQRPRINKIGGARDREQKLAGRFFVLED